MKGLFPTVLGGAWNELPSEVRETHVASGPVFLTGVCQIENGGSLLARLLVWLFGFPPSGRDVPVRVEKTGTATNEVWTRYFATHSMRSFLRLGPSGLQERFGAVTCDIGLQVQTGELNYPVTAAHIGWVPLPKILLPVSITREYAHDGKFWFDVNVLTPLTRAPMIHYRGWLTHPSKS